MVSRENRTREWAWLRKIVRIWDSQYYLQITDEYDFIEYKGGWRYHG